MKNKKFKIAILISHNDENRVRKKKRVKKAAVFNYRNTLWDRDHYKNSHLPNW